MKHNDNDLTYAKIWDSGWRAGLFTGFFMMFIVCLGIFLGYKIVY